MKMMGSFSHEEFYAFLKCLYETLALDTIIEVVLYRNETRDPRHPIRVVIEEKGETSCTWEALQNGALKRWDSRFCLV